MTKLKAAIVSKESLARCMVNFGFSEYLYLGKSDIQNEVWQSESVNEDLFEAIIGAVATDCSWDYSKLEKVCKTMLGMQTHNVLLEKEVEEKSIALGFGKPRYFPNPMWSFYNSPFDYCKSLSMYGMWGNYPAEKANELEHSYSVHIRDGYRFDGYGENDFYAKLDATEQAYRFLCNEEIHRKIAAVDYGNPVSALHELFQKSIVKETLYEFAEYHNESGNPIWNCKAILEGYGSFSANNQSKKHAKQEAALKLLQYITAQEEN